MALVFQAQIHLIGNPLSWGAAHLSLLAYQLLAAVYLLRRRRGFKDLPDGRGSEVLVSKLVLICADTVCVFSGVWQQFVLLGCVCVGGWSVNFVPFLLMDRTLFLYHYLPALCYLYLLSPALLEHVYTHLLRYTHTNNQQKLCFLLMAAGLVVARSGFKQLICVCACLQQWDTPTCALCVHFGCSVVHLPVLFDVLPFDLRHPRADSQSAAGAEVEK